MKAYKFLIVSENRSIWVSINNYCKMQISKKIIGVIGSNSFTPNSEGYRFGLELGKRLCDNDFFIVCGGREGIMEAVCKGAHGSNNYSFGRTIGILPSGNRAEANRWCDIVIPTGMGYSRNQIIVNTAEILISVGGGSGTLSELSFAWQLDKKVICYTGIDGWTKQLAGKDLDERYSGLLIPAETIDGIFRIIDSFM